MGPNATFPKKIRGTSISENSSNNTVRIKFAAII